MKNGLKTTKMGIRNARIVSWVNERHLKESLDHANLRAVARWYHSKYRSSRFKLVDGRKKQPNRIFLHEKLAIKVIMIFRTVDA